MENKENTCSACNMHNGGNCCGCGSTHQCGGMMGGYYKHKFLKKILVLVVMIIVFNLGLKIGELKGMLRSSVVGHGMMLQYGNQMMGGYNQ